MSLSESAVVKEADRRIAYVLAHPGMSAWLKDAVRTALHRDPINVLNDLEILNTLLRARSQALAALVLTQAAP